MSADELDPRVEVVSRALCQSTGMDEKHHEVWTLEARAALAALDKLAGGAS